MDIIVFGAGEDGKKAMPFLEKGFHILFYADNDDAKLGSTLGNYTVKSLKEIQKYDCDVVIASMKYGYEISEQIQKAGISKERLYFCYRSSSDTYKIYPAHIDHFLSNKFPLVHYDLLCEKEQVTQCKKVLVFCTFFSTYAKQLIENMSKRYEDIEFSLLTKTEEYKEKLVSGQLKHIYKFQTMEELGEILYQLPVYDYMQLLWIEREWAYFYKLIRNKTKRLNLNVGGSDFYRDSEEGLKFKKNLIDCADVITAETEATVQEFGDYYGENVREKTHLLPFGIEILEWIDENRGVSKKEIRKKQDIPLDEIIVTCGHNAKDTHQHIKIIDAMEKLSPNIKDQMIFVFPMTYPSDCDVYINKVRDRLKASGLKYRIFTEFMDFKEMAEYALISDIMIHVQETDQLSSTMLEEMYAGSIAIAGRWLPYQSLHKMGMFFLDVDAVSDVSELVEDIVANMERYQKKCNENKRIICEHSAWDSLAPRWHALWE